jgi:hypothetical protein
MMVTYRGALDISFAAVEALSQRVFAPYSLIMHQGTCKFQHAICVSIAAASYVAAAAAATGQSISAKVWSQRTHNEQAHSPQ